MCAKFHDHRINASEIRQGSLLFEEPLKSPVEMSNPANMAPFLEQLSSKKVRNGSFFLLYNLVKTLRKWYFCWIFVTALPLYRNRIPNQLLMTLVWNKGNTVSSSVSLFDQWNLNWHNKASINLLGRCI